MPNVFSILKTRVESNDGVPFLIKIQNCLRFCFALDFFLDFFWMTNFDHLLFIHFNSFLDIYFFNDSNAWRLSTNKFRQ
jgi:hypothetical protein